MKEWNKLNPEIINAYAFFQKMLLNFIKPPGNSINKIYDPLGIKLLTSLRLGFSYLSEHKSRHKIADSLIPLFSCSLETESTLHFFLHCQNYATLGRAIKTHLKNVKVGLPPSKKNCVICLIENPLKMIKNAFYFILKALFVLKIFKFL